MVINCLIISTYLRSVQNIEKGVVCFLYTKRVGCDDRKYLFEAIVLLCRDAVVDEHAYEERSSSRAKNPL